MVIRRQAQGEENPDPTFCLNYVLDGDPGPFEPVNPDMEEEEKNLYQLVKQMNGKISAFAMSQVLEADDGEGHAYTYYLEETSAGPMPYSTYYGGAEEGTLKVKDGAQHAENGEIIFNLAFAGIELPATGGSGTGWLHMMGAGLTGLALAGFMRSRRRRRMP